MQQALVRAVLEESRAWERKSVEEERMWRQRVEQRERAIQDLVSDQREVDQSKLDQMMSKLQAKEEELLQLNRKIADESFRADGFHRTVIALREELDIRRLEQSQLAEQLTSTQRVSMRDADHRQQLEGVASHLRELLRVFRSFVMDVANDFGVPATAIPVFLAGDELTDGLLVSAYEGPLISSLSAVRQCLSERMKATCAIAAQEGAAPLEAELNASKETLRRLIPNAPEANDELARHLPWYVSIARAIEDQLLRLRQEAEDIARGHVSTQLNATAVADEMERLSESHRAVVFEKDTLLRELELQIQAMQKKHAQDMQQQREDLERKTEQLQRRFEKETWKLKGEHQAAVSELNEALEAERKLQTKLKQEALSRRVELERLQSDLQEKPRRLEKEVSALRDELSKWKRKAKLTAKVAAGMTPGTPSRHGSLLMSSSFHEHTDDDSSDSSHRSTMTPSRRPSTAMADLSNLMEQSLHDLRKETTPQPHAVHLPPPPALTTPPRPRPTPLQIAMRMNAAASPFARQPRRRTLRPPSPPRRIGTHTALVPPVQPEAREGPTASSS
ncbi:hypothetical protein PINS_up018435 [Pythium insidiosum]|nr:hypothetical protein PINS_up018435 [Pythium insidiosum]